MNPEQALQRLAHAGIVEQHGAAWRTTPTWERAFMRAEQRVLEFHEAIGDPRLPITYALLDVLGPQVAEADLQRMVDVLLPLEMREEQELEPESSELESELEP
jgi:hypothetical protein